jgi:hypothetical protein
MLLRAVRSSSEFPKDYTCAVAFHSRWSIARTLVSYSGVQVRILNWTPVDAAEGFHDFPQPIKANAEVQK